MLLSTPSWILFWVSTGLATIALIAFVWCVLHWVFGQNQEIGEILYIGAFIYAVIIGIVTGITLWIVASGGVEARNITDDLTTQGYAVGRINTSDDQAEIVLDGRLAWVLVAQDSNGTWHPYQSTAVSHP